MITWHDPALRQSLLNQSTQDHGRWDLWTHLSGATHVMNGTPPLPP